MAIPQWPVLRKPQWRALGMAAEQTYLDRLAQHVADVFPGHARFVARPSGRRFLERTLAAARRHGLRDQHSVALYTDLAVALGGDFEQRHRWIHEILAERGLGAAGRMFLIYKDLPERCPGEPLPPPPDEDDDDGTAMAPPPLVKMWAPGDWG